MAAVVAAMEATGVAAVASGRSKYFVRSLYRRLRAGIRRLHSDRGRWRRQTFSFHYDAFSYALNFDDGRGSAHFVRDRLAIAAGGMCCLLGLVGIGPSKKARMKQRNLGLNR